MPAAHVPAPIKSADRLTEQDRREMEQRFGTLFQAISEVGAVWGHGAAAAGQGLLLLHWQGRPWAEAGTGVCHALIAA